ncbi:MAG: hypothetical protein SGJ18_14555 [Pseudomonadota bacterium]|nr:hypothetical protein [Pseudomonadota bacterium]
MSRITRLLILSLLPSVLASVALAAPEWTIEKVDRAASGNRMVQLNISKNGDKHLVYTGCSDGPCARSELFYSVLAGRSDWQKTSVDASTDDTGTGWFPSIAFDAKSIAHIFYADHEAQTLRYATNKDSKWKTQDLGSGRGGWWTSSAAANGKVYFAHTKLPEQGWENAALEVGTLENDKWTLEVVDGARNAGWFTSMAVLPNGNPVVSYNAVFSQPTGAIKVAIKGANNWDIVDIDNTSVKHHVAVDSAGNIHLVYQKVSSGQAAKSAFSLVHVTNASGTWKRTNLQEVGDEGVNNTGYFPRITTDASGGLHIAYTTIKDQMIYARKLNANTNWEYYSFDDLGGTYYPWIEVEPSGMVSIAYERSGNIYLATCSNCSSRGKP